MPSKREKTRDNKAASENVTGWTDEGLLEVREVAEKLRLSTAKVYALMSSGDLPHVSMDRAKRVPVAALRDYMTRNLKGVMPAEVA